MTLERLLIAAALCLPGTALASAQGEKDDLLALLDEQTALATKTRLNTDYVPGMMSVLHGTDLELRGVRTVWEALALVPGIERAMESNGRRRLLVRGVGNVWGSGNVKLLLNDVAMNTAERGLADPLLNIPIEQVERIEVVRGPGSAVHGEFAYLGVVNVITRREASRVFAFGGSNSTFGGGAVAAWSEGNSKFSASISGWQTDGSDVRSGPDRLHPTDPTHSHAPGLSNEALEAGTGIIALEGKDYSLLLQWSEDGLGDHFGINEALPPRDEQVVELNRHQMVEGRKALSMAPGFGAELFLGWQDAMVRTNGMYIGQALSAGGDSADIFKKSAYEERRWYGGTDLRWQASERHNILLGLKYTAIEVRESETRSNYRYDPATEKPLAIDEYVPQDVVQPGQGKDRDITSVSLQDEFRATKDFTLTAGLRHDEYSDTGVHTSPRIAGVWRLDDNRIIKAQYAEAFRPQTLYELDEDERYATFGALRPATVRTYELEYIRKGMHWDSKLTAFYSKLNDLITVVEEGMTVGFANLDSEAWGLEWEHRHRISARLEVDGNISYLDTRDTDGNALPGAPQWLANVGTTYRLPSGIVWGIQLHHVGDMARHPDDLRPELGGYTAVDVTATLTRLALAGATWSIGVKNAFDEDVRYPSEGGYPEDYPRAGREWWTRLTYEF
ncbi:MAG: TonB-dependent receptor [Gammaproteobacteria bacterium]|nr:TonB-dependent receptor [Gammaproteobacteria bacterium]